MKSHVAQRSEPDPSFEASAQHARIDAMLEAVLNATGSEDPAVLQRTWAELEEELSTHLDYEEREIFPIVEAQLPATVARLRQDHRRIRELLCRLGVAADLHTLGHQTAIELIQVLHIHLAYEEMTVYPLSRGRAASVQASLTPSD